jgi:ribonuclease BN (tRNA processing enzyme)
VTVRELVVLGTASQAPTRTRNHNGYLLRWDGEGLLFDPGEGTQRQMLLAGVPSSAVTHLCISHFHGDHCLGVPGWCSGCRWTVSRTRCTRTSRRPGASTSAGCGPRRSSTRSSTCARSR